MIQASCHCGAVTFEVERAPTVVTACNCSLCRRTGVLFAYYSPTEVRFTGAPASAQYQWGEKSITFHHCPTCFCLTHWSANDPASKRMGVNARLIDPAILESARVRRLDGADTWEELA